MVEANFDSHLEKGTIEMSNEYYNLLEEKMVRLINENQELKKQLEELDKKLFFTKNELEMRQKSIDNKLNHKQLKDLVKIQKSFIEIKNQQKEFIEYMNKTIEELECEDVDDEEMKGYLIQRMDTFKEILSKYKEIIGDE